MRPTDGWRPVELEDGSSSSSDSEDQVLEVVRTGKLRAMIERAGYAGVAAAGRAPPAAAEPRRRGC